MDVPLNAKVRCTDGAGGKVTVIVVDPATQHVTHVVIENKGVEVLAPIDVITASGPDHIQLSWSLAELAQAAPFEQVVYVGDEASAEAAGLYAVPSIAIPATLDTEYMTEAVEISYLNLEQVPPNELAIHRGASVEARDGRVGQVDEFVIDADSGQITHVVLRQGHLWGKREVTVPLSAIASIHEDVVYLNLDKAAVERLPHVSVKTR